MVGRLERVHKGKHCGFLRLCPCVFGRLAVCGKTTDIAHTDTGGIMPFAVGANLTYLSPLLHRAIETDDIVVADAVETALAMPAVDVGCRIVTPSGCGGAVDDYLVDSAHGFR